MTGAAFDTTGVHSVHWAQHTSWSTSTVNGVRARHGRGLPAVNVRHMPPRRDVVFVGAPGAAVAEQTFTSDHDGLTRVEVVVSEPSGSGTFEMTLLDGPGRVLAQTTVPLSELHDGGWVRVDLPPIDRSGGAAYTLRLMVDKEGDSGWVALRTGVGDTYAGGALLQGAPRVGTS